MRSGPRIRIAAALAVAACALPGAVALAAGGTHDATATESLGTHLAPTGISGLIPNADGSILAVQGAHLRAIGAGGTVAPAFASPKVPTGARFFPVAGGKTLVVGERELLRLDPDGALDTSFAAEGRNSVASGSSAAYELGSGAIAFVRVEISGAKGIYVDVHVEILNQDGTVDPGKEFSASVGTPYGNIGEEIGVAEFAPTGDGGALVVGHDFLLKLTADGSVERGFGKGGELDVSHVAGARVLADGSIETVGTATEESADGTDLAVARYTATGAPEESFGPKGVRQFDLGGRADDRIWVVSWGADGSAIVGGRTSPRGPCPGGGCEETPILAAVDPEGKLDPSFGQDGVSRLSTLAGPPQPYPMVGGVTALARRPDGSIVAAGSAPPNRPAAFLAAFSPAGALLPGFGEGGIVLAPEELPASQRVEGLVPLADGGVLAAGSTDVGFGETPVLIRYRSDDRLDRSFGEGSGYRPLAAPQADVPASRIATDGKDLLVGRFDHLSLLRLSDGSPVASFGSGGTIDLPRRSQIVAPALAGDGDPLVLTRRIGGPSELVSVLRYRPDGTPDRAFGHGGKYALRLRGKPVHGRSILAGPGERILVAGSLGRRFAIVSLLPDGRPDPRFGRGGWTVAKVPGSARYAMLSRLGDHVYLAGTVRTKDGDTDQVLMRFDRDGHLDRGFGRDGTWIVPLKFATAPVSVLSTPRGPLVVLGAGPRPLLTFGRAGKVTRQAVAGGQGVPYYVRAAVSGKQLILGWNTYPRARGGSIYHLTRRPLAGL